MTIRDGTADAPPTGWNASEEDPDSILNYYRTLVRLRKEYPVIAEGSIRFYNTQKDGVLCYEREPDGKVLTVLCSFLPETASYRLEETAAARLENGTLLLSSYTDASERPAGELRPFEAVAVLN